MKYDWNTSSVTSVYQMFKNASAFNQPLTKDGNKWNTLNVTNMQRMFNNTTSFNQDLTSWCVSNIAAEPANFATISALTSDKNPSGELVLNTGISSSVVIIS